MARPKTPTALHLVKGDKRPSRQRQPEPVPAAREVTPPSGLEGEALAVWEEHAPDLIAKKVLTCWDVEAFALWCDAVAMMREARGRLRETGAVVEAPVFDRNGKQQEGTRLQRSDWLFVWKDAADVMHRVGAKFGLTPSDRANVEVPDDASPAGVTPEALLS